MNIVVRHNQIKMFEIQKLFEKEVLTETSKGNYKTICPDCGLQGGRTEGFILFSDGNRSFCHSSNKHFTLLETYALKKKIIRCIDGRESGEKQSILKGDLYTQALDAFEEEYTEEEYNELLNQIGHKKRIELPNNGKLISEFADELARRIKNEEIFFYRGDTKKIVEIGKIKHADGKTTYNGFVDVTGNRFVTLMERYFKPWAKIYTKQGEMVIIKSMSQSVANTVIESDDFMDKMPVINRIFPVQIPVIFEGQLTFPKKGYDKRFASWLPYNAVSISNPNIPIDDAKKIIDSVLSEFCFKSEQDKINAISGLITPFLKGLFSAFNVRVPLFIYEANRERAGKDYLAGITGILYEGCATENPPISTGDRMQNNSDELRKKILSAMIVGKKRLHFSNNKGHLNNATLESVITLPSFSDRVLGKSSELSFDNEIDFSLSGNIGMTLTADLSNRSRFIRLFLDIEDANSRTFSYPDLHGWVFKNRELVLSALYSLIKNWIGMKSPPGSIPFASFPEWSNVCGGIMECAGYGNPCVRDNDTSGIAMDTETSNMKTLFEICHEHRGEEWLKKGDVIEIIKTYGEDIFTHDWDKKSDQTRFAMMFLKYIGRVFSKIKLIVRDKTTRTARWEFMFTIEEPVKKSISLVGLGNLGNFGNLVNPVEHLYKKGNGLEKVTKVAKVAKPLKEVSDREVQFWEAEECKSIKPSHTKQDILEYINANPNYDFKVMYDKYGVGCLKFRNELKREGLI